MLGLAVLLGLSLVRARKPGREQRRRSEKGQRRVVNLARYYSAKLSNIAPGDFVFRVVLVRTEYRRKKRRLVTVNRFVESLSWTDDARKLVGSATLRRPDRLDPKTLPVRRGQAIRLDVRWRKKWYRLWTMAIAAEPEVDRTTGTVTLELADALELLRRDLHDWEYRKDDRHKDGWTADQIAVAVARKVGIPVGRLAKGKKKIEKLKLDEASAYEVLKKAYAEEASETRRKYIIRIYRGKLEVVPLRRNRIVYVLRNLELRSSTLGEPKTKKAATVIKAKGRTKDGKKLELTVARPRVVRRLGRVEKEYDAGRVDGTSDLREKAKRELYRELKIKRTAEIEIPILPFLTRGEAFKWINREPGWHGPSKTTRDRQYGFVEAVTHSLSAASGSTLITLGQRDEFLADQRRRDRELRKSKERKREGKKK